MTRLTSRDLRALLDVVHTLYTCHDLQAFPAQLFATLPQVVPSEITSYNEVNPPQHRLAWLADPPGSLEFPDSKPIFEAHMSEHPLITYYHSSRTTTEPTTAGH